MADEKKTVVLWPVDFERMMSVEDVRKIKELAAGKEITMFVDAPETAEFDGLVRRVASGALGYSSQVTKFLNSYEMNDGFYSYQVSMFEFIRQISSDGSSIKVVPIDSKIDRDVLPGAEQLKSNALQKIIGLTDNDSIAEFSNGLDRGDFSALGKGMMVNYSLGLQAVDGMMQLLNRHAIDIISSKLANGADLCILNISPNAIDEMAKELQKRDDIALLAYRSNETEAKRFVDNFTKVHEQAKQLVGPEQFGSLLNGVIKAISSDDPNASYQMEHYEHARLSLLHSSAKSSILEKLGDGEMKIGGELVKSLVDNSSNMLYILAYGEAPEDKPAFYKGFFHIFGAYQAPEKMGVNTLENALTRLVFEMVEIHRKGGPTEEADRTRQLGETTLRVLSELTNTQKSGKSRR